PLDGASYLGRKAPSRGSRLLLVVVDPLGGEAELLLRSLDRLLRLLAVTTLLLPHALVRLLRGVDPTLGVVERIHRLLHVRVALERTGSEHAGGEDDRGGEQDGTKLGHCSLLG